jgi:hypothetical protein
MTVMVWGRYALKCIWYENQSGMKNRNSEQRVSIDIGKSCK